MQNTRTRDPSFEGWADAFPTRPAALATTPKHRAPQIAEPVWLSDGTGTFSEVPVENIKVRLSWQKF
jgi:hypothetical protein